MKFSPSILYELYHLANAIAHPQPIIHKNKKETVDNLIRVYPKNKK